MGSRVKRKLDYSDYLSTPDDGNRYEILCGDLHVTACPTPKHQRVSRRLCRLLDEYFETRSIGEVFYARLAVIFTSHDIAEPDLLVVDDPGLISDRGIEGPPLLIVEILSPSTRSRDEGVKARRYAELGVPHYWKVDPEARHLRCHRLVDGEYRLVLEGEGEASVVHPEWDGLVLDLGELWR